MSTFAFETDGFGDTSRTSGGLKFPFMMVGEACLIKPEPPAPAPFIGKIKEIWRTGSDDEAIELVLSWYYRPEEAVGGRKEFHGAKELFISDHLDRCNVAAVIGKCRVLPLKKYESLAAILENDFFVRFTYKPAKKEFEPDRVPVYCVCELPYSPDKDMIMCDICQEWFHPECIGLPKSFPIQADTSFHCDECKKKGIPGIANKKQAV
eukprot:gene21538-28530_t